MKLGGAGGANTSAGLDFEKKVDFQTALAKIEGYQVKKLPSLAGKSIFYKEENVAHCFKKYDFYKFLEERGVNWQAIISKRLLPDDALYVSGTNTLFVIEVKFQRVAGSVDEKLQTCDFKKRQYIKLLNSTGITVEYVYVLNDWFRDNAYKDVCDYIKSVGCHFFFDKLPLSFLGLPES